MKIAAVAAQLPSKLVNNDDILAIIHKNSESIFEGNLKHLLKKIKFLLEYSGSNTRCWLGENETPLEHIQTAFANALSQAKWQKEEIDLLIYVGVGKAVTEPANSYLLAQALELKNVHCFDVLDACMSWMRALQLAHLYFKAGIYKKIMVVNAEFNVLANHQGGVGFPELFTYRHVDEIPYKFPALTIGEAATVTLLADDDSSFECHFKSMPYLADLCTIPSKDFELFLTKEQLERVGKNGVGLFTSFGFDMHKIAVEHINAFLKEHKHLWDSREVDHMFVHASSRRVWEDAVHPYGYSEKMYHIYGETGNLVSASVPAALFKAQQENRLKRGDKIAFVVGSAGMSFALAYLTF